MTYIKFLTWEGCQCTFILWYLSRRFSVLLLPSIHFLQLLLLHQDCEGCWSLSQLPLGKAGLCPDQVTSLWPHRKTNICTPFTNLPQVHGFRLWEEAGVPCSSTQRTCHFHTERSQAWNPQSSCCEATMLITSAPCRCHTTENISGFL